MKKMSNEKLKMRILEEIDKEGDICITFLPKLIPEMCGNDFWTLQLSEGDNKNILALAGITYDACCVLHDMIRFGVLTFSSNILFFSADGAPGYGLPIFTQKDLKSQKRCWVPMILSRKSD